MTLRVVPTVVEALKVGDEIKLYTPTGHTAWVWLTVTEIVDVQHHRAGDVDIDDDGEKAMLLWLQADANDTAGAQPKPYPELYDRGARVQIRLDVS